MTDDHPLRHNKRTRIWLAIGGIVLVLAVVLVPPLVSVSRYKSRIAGLMASSLGRPVRLSSVGLRLLPRPGFVLDDLTVEEDPAYGAESVLHAGRVTASIRLLSLWRGRLELGEISVDEASLNLVRAADGRWNLESLLETAAAKAGSGQTAARNRAPFPYLEATNSRINFKNGVEKLPFSLVNADISFWQESPADWRIRLRGQPARTDLSLNLADTGILEMEARARRAPDLRRMPIHLDLQWRDAQLGQLTRLVLGADAGWRGDLRGELHLDGDAETAQLTARLRAAGVHRAEFAPAAPMDFDANCALVYHYSERAAEKLACDSPLGNGHIRLAGDLPPNGAAPHLSVELDRLPVAALLDALRTVRSGIAPGLQAGGAVSGKLAYAEDSAAAPTQQVSSAAKPVRPARSRLAKASQAPGPLAGSLTVEGFEISGGGLSHPIQAPRLMLQPSADAQKTALAGTVAIPAGAPLPLTLNLLFGLKGYRITVRGPASIARAAELARAAGIEQAAALDSLSASPSVDPLGVDLTVEGPWLPPAEASSGNPSAAAAPSAASSAAVKGSKPSPASNRGIAEPINPAADTLTGTVAFHNVGWKAGYLAGPVEISEAALHLQDGAARWDPVVFSYGPLKGTASLTVPPACSEPEPCAATAMPTFSVQFGDLDAATIQAAILGARQKGTLLSDLIARLHPTTSPLWPRLEGAVKASSLILGPVTLKNASADLRILPSGAEIDGLDALMLGGHVHASGALAAGDKPTYTVAAEFQRLNPAAIGQLLGESWRGGAIDAAGKIELSGYTAADLAASAKGNLHLDWRHGAVAAGANSATQAIPAPLSRFDRWTADAAIGSGSIVLGENQLLKGSSKSSIVAAVKLADPPRLSFAASGQTAPKKQSTAAPLQ